MNNTTLNYDLFRFFDYNRDLAEGNIKSKMESISKIGFQGSILCHKESYEDSGLLYIVDGQHRFEALKRMGMPIPYEFVSGEPSALIRELNKSQREWATLAYIKQHALRGIPNYKELYDLALEIGTTNAIYVYGEGNVKPTALKDGVDFPVNKNFKEILQYIEGIRYEFKWHHKFVKAVVLLFKYGDNYHKEKLARGIHTCPKCASTADYLVAFENIINANLRRKEPIKLVSRK